MDEHELVSIIKKNKDRGIVFFICAGILFSGIHFYYDNFEAISTLAYSIGLIGLAMIITMSFCEKVMIDVLKKLSLKDNQK